MKHIQTFEKYSMPDSIETLGNELTEYISNIFEKWFMRKGLANYSELHFFKPKEKNEDFPVSLVKLRTIFIYSINYIKFGVGGTSYSSLNNDLKGNNIPKDILEMAPIIKDNGDTEIGIEIKIYLPKYINSIDKNETMEQIKSTIYHELEHSYRNYKLSSKNIPADTHLPIFDNSLFATINKLKLYFLADLIHITYILITKVETEAYLSQLYTKKGNYWIPLFLKIRKMPYDEINKEIKDEIKSKNINSDKVLKIFNARMQNPVDNIDDLIYLLYQVIDSKKEYVFRKIAKIVTSPEYIKIAKKYEES